MVVVVAAADGTAAHKKPAVTGQMRKVNIGWFLVRYEEDDGVEELLKLPGNAFNNNARGSWRVDLDFEASGGIEGGGGGGGDERGRCNSGGGGNGDASEDESGKEESGDESEDESGKKESGDESGVAISATRTRTKTAMRTRTRTRTRTATMVATMGATSEVL